MALDLILESNKTKFIIFSDSMSALTLIKNRKQGNLLLIKILKLHAIIENKDSALLGS